MTPAECWCGGQGAAKCPCQSVPDPLGRCVCGLTTECVQPCPRSVFEPAGAGDPDAAYVLDAGYVTKDSGRREEFATGSLRDTRDGKGRYDLIPPSALRRLAQVYERGAVKYGERNWEKGQPLSRYLDSAIRHAFDYLEGKRDEDHLAQAAWNLLSAIHTEEMVARGLLPLDLADLPEPA